mgnify:CR=1 FL=1
MLKPKSQKSFLHWNNQQTDNLKNKLNEIPLLDTGEKEFSTYKMFKAKVFNKRFLTTRKGKYKGYPFRSFSFGNYRGGYSDHYPVYLYLIKEQPD